MYRERKGQLMEYRTFPRIETNLISKVHFGNRQLIASIKLFSEDFLRIKCGSAFKSGQRLLLETELLPERVLRVEAQVMCCLETVINNQVVYMSDIFMLNMRESDMALIHEFLAARINRRRQRRTRVMLNSSVIQPQLGDNLPVLNATENSLFIATDKAVPEKSHVRVILRMPRTSVMLDGVVVHRIDPQRAARMGCEAGLGLQILKMPQEEQPAWNDFLEGWNLEQSTANKAESA